MSFESSIIRNLEATRLLEKELALGNYKQQLERQRLTQELDSINQSRRLAIQREIDSAKKEYEDKLRFEKDLAAEVQARQRRAEEDRKAVLLADIKLDKDRLNEENRRSAQLEADYAVLEEKLARLKANSKLSYQHERASLARLEGRRADVLELANQSRIREDALVAKLQQLRLQL